MDNYDVTIIGAGPIGLFAAFEAGMHNLNCVVIENLSFVGGQCSALYPEKPIYDIPGFPNITAQNLIGQLKEQAAPFNPKYLLGQQVTQIKKDSNYWLVNTSKDTTIKSKTIIIAAGGGAFGPNKPPIPELEKYENKSVFYTVVKKDALKGKTIVIAGGGDSAVDWAILLSEIAKKVYVVHRREKFKALPENVKKLKEIAANGNLELIIPYQLHSLKGKNGYLNTVIVSDLNNNIKELETDVLLPFFGLSMELGYIKDFGVEIESRHIKVTQSTMQTNLPGVFAIGDICCYP